MCIGKERLQTWCSVGYEESKTDEGVIPLGTSIADDQSCDENIARRIGLASSAVSK